MRYECAQDMRNTSSGDIFFRSSPSPHGRIGPCDQPNVTEPRFCGGNQSRWRFCTARFRANAPTANGRSSAMQRKTSGGIRVQLGDRETMAACLALVEFQASLMGNTKELISGCFKIVAGCLHTQRHSGRAKAITTI